MGAQGVSINMSMIINIKYGPFFVSTPFWKIRDAVRPLTRRGRHKHNLRENKVKYLKWFLFSLFIVFTAETGQHGRAFMLWFEQIRLEKLVLILLQMII